jgi:hypothetical protein
MNSQFLQLGGGRRSEQELPEFFVWRACTDHTVPPSSPTRASSVANDATGRRNRLAIITARATKRIIDGDGPAQRIQVFALNAKVRRYVVNCKRRMQRLVDAVPDRNEVTARVRRAEHRPLIA